MLRRAAPTSPPLGSALSTMLHASRISDPPPIALVTASAVHPSSPPSSPQAEMQPHLAVLRSASQLQQQEQQQPQQLQLQLQLLEQRQLHRGSPRPRVRVARPRARQRTALLPYARAFGVAAAPPAPSDASSSSSSTTTTTTTTASGASAQRQQQHPQANQQHHRQHYQPQPQSQHHQQQQQPSPRAQRDARMPAGFWNMGQSCHLGATLTALAAVPSMQRWVHSRDSAVARALLASANGVPDVRISTGGAANSGGHVRAFSASSSYGASDSARALDPRAVAQQIDDESWRSIEAQDAHETLGRLITVLEDEVRATRVLDQPPPPRAPLYGFSTVIRTCETCGASSDAMLQTFSVLSLPLPTSNRSLAPAFIDAFASTDVDVQAHCEMCGSTEPHSRMHSIARFPQVLVLHLQKAFLTADESIDASRYTTSFPEILALPRGNPVPPIPRKLRYHEEPATTNGRGATNGEFRMHSQRSSVPYRQASAHYNLRAVVQHHGGAGSSAHFIAVVGGGVGSAEDGLAGLSGGRWWLVDDGRVRRCTRAYALNPRSAYLLFYELTDDP